MLVADAGLHLPDPPVGAERAIADPPQERDELAAADLLPGPLDAVVRGDALQRVQRDRRRRGGAVRDRRGGGCRLADSGDGQLLGVPVPGLISLDDPHADAKLHVRGGAVHGAVLEAHRARHPVLEERVGVVTAPGERRAERLVDHRLVHAELGEVDDLGARGGHRSRRGWRRDRCCRREGRGAGAPHRCGEAGGTEGEQEVAAVDGVGHGRSFRVREDRRLASGWMSGRGRPEQSPR